MAQPIRIYYDGLCQLCSREVHLLDKLAPAGAIECVDIVGEGFDPLAHGLDPVAIHGTMHVRDTEGKMQTGLNALITMWRPVPYFRWLARLSSLPGIHQMSKVGYVVFAKVRPWLPRRKCDAGTCRVR